MSWIPSANHLSKMGRLAFEDRSSAMDSRRPQLARQAEMMAENVPAAGRELLEQTMATMDALLAATDREMSLPSSHACAQGKDVWTLITNDIDHEKIHTGQVLEGRYESCLTASPME